jgi:hypothetical protein
VVTPPGNDSQGPAPVPEPDDADTAENPVVALNDALRADGEPVQERRLDQRRMVWAFGGIIGAVAIALVVSLLLFQALFPDPGTQQAAPTESTTSAESTATPTEEETTEEETTSASPTPASPAPKDAEDLKSFSSPSGKITWALSGDAAACTVAEPDFDRKTEDCDGDPFSIRVSGKYSGLACGRTFYGSDPKELSYGESTATDNVACTSEKSGITCWNTWTGKGFRVDTAGYEAF